MSVVTETMCRNENFNRHEQKILRKTLRNNSTVAECVLWKRLSGRKVDGLKFRRQHGCGAYVMDFFCPELSLCIEIDGGYHNLMEVARYDTVRTGFLREHGITVLRFDNDTVFHNIDYIIDCIREFREERELRHTDMVKP